MNKNIDKKNSLPHLHSIIVESEILKMLTFNLVYALNNKLETDFLPQCLQYTLISLGPSFLFTSTLIKLSLVLSNLDLR